MAQQEITGLFQYLKWGVGTASAGLGLVSGGDLSNDPDVRSREGIGGGEIRRGGMCKFGGNAEFYVSSTNQALVGYGFRNAYPRGTLQELVFDGGADQWGRVYGTSVVNTLDLSWSVGEALKASVAWGALTIAEGAGSTHPEEVNTDWEDYEFTALFEGYGYAVRSLGVKVNNNVTYLTNGDAKTPGQIRWPVSYLIGSESLEVELTTGRPLPLATLDLFADTLPTNLGITLVATGGPSLVLTNLQPGPEGYGQKDNNTQTEWKYTFNGSKASGSAAWTFG